MVMSSFPMQAVHTFCFGLVCILLNTQISALWLILACLVFVVLRFFFFKSYLLVCRSFGSFIIKHYTKEINHFFCAWTGSSTLNKQTYEINIDYEIYPIALVASGLIIGDPFYCLLIIFIYFIATGKLKLHSFFRKTHVESSNTQMDQLVNIE